MKGTRRISHGARRRRNGTALDLRPPRFSRPQFSNRQNPLAESGLSCCKQTLRARSNRQIFRGSANFCFHISNFGDSFRIAVPLVPSKAEGSEHREPRDLSVSFISIRQCFQVDSAATHSQQRIGAPAIRQFFGRKDSHVPGKGSLGDQTGNPIFKFPISNLAFPDSEESVKQNQLFLPASLSKQTIGAQNKCQFFAICFSLEFRFSSFGHLIWAGAGNNVKRGF